MDYTTVSEAAGVRVTREALDMLYTRYSLAAELAANRDALEVACGPGHGLGLVAKKARSVIGGDYVDDFARAAHQHYCGRIPILRLDAQRLPFRERSFDLVLFLEAIYYIADVPNFLIECRRVLRTGGVLFLCTVNKDWPEFNPSPFSTSYLDGAELAQLLREHGFSPCVFGAFPVNNIPTLIRRIRRIAVRLRLIPKTMRGKELLKRLFYGKLVQLRSEIQDGVGSVHSLTELDSCRSSEFKVIYVIGTAI